MPTGLYDKDSEPAACEPRPTRSIFNGGACGQPKRPAEAQRGFIFRNCGSARSQARVKHTNTMRSCGEREEQRDRQTTRPARSKSRRHHSNMAATSKAHPEGGLAYPEALDTTFSQQRSQQPRRWSAHMRP
ncbi:unnamed protein product [Prorocentrum cordatum]|uniref:Uncharacterized protein n=1 Tax=Prorocentrum cordatum TaxID=2364126 RepID=A0ABN9RHV9_9DINO|nr:unnamed protein product [Polarella glacialis]